MKLGLLITARLKSSRLPLKLLRRVNGEKLIDKVINRAKLVSNVDGIVLCTSINPQDKPLVDVALSQHIYYYLGDEEDVLQRIRCAAEFFKYDYILSITGENPFFCIDYANRVVDEINKTNADFIYIEGLPLGCAVSGIKTKALNVVCSIKKEVDTEIWGPLINRPEIFDVRKIEVEPFFNRPNIRITTDYPEDFEFINAIASHFSSNEVPSLFDVCKLFDLKPELLLINRDRQQAQLSTATLKKINDFFASNKNEILEFKKQVYQ